MVSLSSSYTRLGWVMALLALSMMAAGAPGGSWCPSGPGLVRQRAERGAEMVSTPPLDRDELSFSMLTPEGIVNFCSNSLQEPRPSCLAETLRMFPSVLT